MIETLTPEERKRKLGRGFGKFAAAKTGTKPGHVSQVLSGKRPDRDVERLAARRLRMKIEDLFPEYYPDKHNGQPRVEA